MQNGSLDTQIQNEQLVQQLEGSSCEQDLGELPTSTRKSRTSFPDFRCDSSNRMHDQRSNINCFEKTPNINAEEEQKKQIGGYAFGSTNYEDFRTAEKQTTCEKRKLLRNDQTAETYNQEGCLGSCWSDSSNPVSQVMTPDEVTDWQAFRKSNTDTEVDNLKIALDDKIEELDSVKLHNRILRQELHKAKKFEELYNQLKQETDGRNALLEDLQAENMALKEQVNQFQEDFNAERRAYKHALKEKKLKERDCRVYEQERDEAIKRAQQSELKLQGLEREILALNERIHMMTLNANQIVSRSTSQRISSWDMGDKEQFYTLDASDSSAMEINLDVHSSNNSEFEELELEEDGAVGGTKMKR